MKPEEAMKKVNEFAETNPDFKKFLDSFGGLDYSDKIRVGAYALLFMLMKKQDIADETKTDIIQLAIELVRCSGQIDVVLLQLKEPLEKAEMAQFGLELDKKVGKLKRRAAVLSELLM